MVFYVATLLIVTGVALYVASPLMSGAPRLRRSKDPDELVTEHWEHEHALAVQGLRELEFDREMGKLADADYQSLRAALETRALESMTALEKLRDDIRQKRLAALEALKAKPAPATREPVAALAETPPATAPASTSPATAVSPATTIAPMHPSPEPRWTPGASFAVAEHRADQRIGARRTRFCPQCGFRVLANSNFCGECGAALRAGERTATRAS